MPTFPPYTAREAQQLERAHDAAPLDRIAPFYRQSLDITCGPAALMMAMAYFDPDVPLDRDLEIELWREANLVEVWGTSREGLAIAAARRGFEVATQGDPAGASFVDELVDEIPGLDEEVLDLFYEDTRDRFDRLDLEDASEALTVDHVVDALYHGHLPLCLTDAAVLGGEAAVPHWVLARGYTEDAIVLNDPQADGPGTEVARGTFADALGFRGITCAVYLGPRTRERRRPHR